MWKLHSFQALNRYLGIRWRLALVSLGLFLLLLGLVSLLLSIATEQALLSNSEASLRDQALIAVKSLHTHPFTLSPSPGPPDGLLTPELTNSANQMLNRLSSLSTDVAILSTQGTVILSSHTLSITPPPVELAPERVLNSLNTDEGHLLAEDSQGQRQLIVLIPLVSQQHLRVAILQLGTQLTNIDDFITTFHILLVIGGLGAFGLAIAFTFPLVGAALRPLVDIERTSRRIAAGDLSKRIETIATDDEVGRLAISFNQMVEKLEYAFQLQKRFVADASHELRTPLTALSGSLEMLLIGADQGDIQASRRLARGMYAEVQRMHRLVEDLLALTRLDEGKLKLRKEVFHVQSIVESVSQQAQQLAHGQIIRTSIAPSTPPIYADRDKVQQVLLNIVGNSLKFTPSGGTIELMVFLAERHTVAITVRDTGQGISPEALPYVFDRFFRADSARSRPLPHKNGNGLGLAIAKELIEAQRGTIRIESMLGKGTTITIGFPCVDVD
jgi:two-component system OmpR family sensor kinase